MQHIVVRSRRVITTAIIAAIVVLSLVLAAPTLAATTYSGTMPPHAWWGVSFYAAIGDTVIITVTCSSQGTPTISYTDVIRPSGSYQYVNSQSGTTAGCNATANFTATQTGNYFLELVLHDLENNPYDYSATIYVNELPPPPDGDGDGVPDGSDNCPAVPNPDQANTDGDSLGDACDTDLDGDGVTNAADVCPAVFGHATASGCPDPDGDGFRDDNGADVCPAVFGHATASGCPDPDSDGIRNDNGDDLCPAVFGQATANGCPDADGDTWEDSADNCPTVANADQANVDGDSFGDACDPLNDLDVDGDSVDNAVDNCPLVSNADQANIDGDSLGDACDPLNDLDVDGDGVDNVADNCPAVANADQANIDGDSLGDACDPLNDLDVDGDGVDNVADNCPAIANPGQEDVDGDGTGDACDSLNNRDVDADGVWNSADNCPKNANPLQQDADGDGGGDVCDDFPNNPWNEPPFTPGDSRLNQHPKDRGASAAVYCSGNDFNVYRIDDQSKGTFVLSVTKTQIDAVGVPVGANALIGSVDVPLGQIQVWRLTTGEFQLMAAPVRAGGDPYSFIWRDCQIRR